MRARGFASSPTTRRRSACLRATSIFRPSSTCRDRREPRCAVYRFHTDKSARLLRRERAPALQGRLSHPIPFARILFALQHAPHAPHLARDHAAQRRRLRRILGHPGVRGGVWRNRMDGRRRSERQPRHHPARGMVSPPAIATCRASRPHLARDRTVETRQLIGYVGSTGRSTGPAPALQRQEATASSSIPSRSSSTATASSPNPSAPRSTSNAPRWTSCSKRFAPCRAPEATGHKPEPDGEATSRWKRASS